MVFKEKVLQGGEPDRCVDGRQDPESAQGPQMLGGSLHPLVIFVVANNHDVDHTIARNTFAKLKEKMYTLGVHQGSHQEKNSGMCDCGFCDRLKKIVSTAIGSEYEIKRRLHIYQANSLDPTSLETAFRVLRLYSPDKIKISGEPLIVVAQEAGATVETVRGDHQEEVAFVNLKPNTTFDTKAANREGRQAFNLDLWRVVEEAGALGVDETLTKDLSLILYQATEMVLVEQKGRAALPVVVRK